MIKLYIHLVRSKSQSVEIKSQQNTIMSRGPLNAPAWVFFILDICEVNDTSTDTARERMVKRSSDRGEENSALNLA